LRTNELIDVSKKVIGEKMDLDYLSRFYGTLIFRQFKDKISESEIETIRNALFANGIYSQLQVTSSEYLLRVIAEYSTFKKENTIINLLLFFATILTTTLTGASLIWNNPFSSFENYLTGLPYAFALILFFSAHEMGHYYFARKHHIHATWPYFIPFYFEGLFHIGTFGAFIKIKSPIPNKKALLDVGIAGPIAGFIISLLLLYIGFSQLPNANGVRSYVEQMHPWEETGTGALTLGSSILFEFIRYIMGGTHLPMYEVYHFPFIFAGWVGLLATAINLIPVGQLDGGHISYALFGKDSRYISYASFLGVVILTIFHIGWLIWVLLLLFLIRFKHPPTIDDNIELDDTRKKLAWLSYVIFLISFPPIPVYFP